MIVFDNGTQYYKSNVGLEKVSVRINKGDFVFLVGPSGAGKSTFIKLILKEIDATSGSIKVRGREVTTMSNRQVPILRRNIGIVFQDFRLLKDRNIYENIAFALRVTETPTRIIKQKVPAALSLVGLAQKYKAFPKELSGGEQQRVSIARAVIRKPDIILADEPTGNLDRENTKQVMNLLKECQAMYSQTIIMVTHDIDLAKRADALIYMEDGQVKRYETP